jgi:hypothetical protein
MTPLDNKRWLGEVDEFVRQFAERAERSWDATPGDLEDSPAPPWTADHPDEQLDAAYRSGIAPPEQRGADGWCGITILRARGRRLAKLIGHDGSVVNYDSARRFDLNEIPISGVDDLGDDLQALLYRHNCCVVRGAIADLGRCRNVRRLLHPDGDDPASLVETPRRWLALDIDGIERPACIAAEDIIACANTVVAALPTEFRAARSIAQATAGHGFKLGIHMRLWYWLDRPVFGAELKRWLPPDLVDHALFGAAQIVYTASPLFDGRSDPLPNRLIRLPGMGQVAVPDLPEPKPRHAAKPLKPATGLSRYAEAALDSACQRIINAPKKEQERTLNRESFAIGTLAGCGAIPAAFARAALLHAGNKMPDYDSNYPWREREIRQKVDHAFDAGINRPREAS